MRHAAGGVLKSRPPPGIFIGDVMGNLFLISDTHFFHKNILQYETKHRPFDSVEEMNEVLVDNWNKAVKPEDTVWHLGDVLFGSKNFHILDRLNGKKNLVLGNHDHYGKGVASYLEKFDKVQASFKIDSTLLTHVPIHPCQFVRFSRNIHGHMHSKVVMDGTGSSPDRRYVCVSVEQIGLTPIAYDCI